VTEVAFPGAEARKPGVIHAGLVPPPVAPKVGAAGGGGNGTASSSNARPRAAALAGPALGGASDGEEEKWRRQWRSMAQHGLPAFVAEQPEVFHRRARRGVPTEHRWQAWKAAMRVEERTKPGVYQEYLQVENQWTRLIEIDVPRTFPDFTLFDKEQQFSLLRVLNAFANLDPQVGYCQGMNFVAGLLLFVAQNGDFRQSPRFEKEEEAFWMLVCLMSDGRLSGFYRRHFPLLRRYLWAFDHLLAEHLPDLQAHFFEENVQHAVYLHQWFLTLFINCLPMPMVLVFWDAIICGGKGLEVVLPITVSLLQVLQNVLLSLSFEEIVRFFKTMRAGEPNTDDAQIGRLVVAKCGAIRLPARITEKLRLPLPDDDDMCMSPCPSGGCEEFVFSPQRRGGDADGHKADPRAGGPTSSLGSAFGDWAAPEGVVGSYLRNLSEMGRDLPQGVRSWWEENRGNYLQRVGFGQERGEDLRQ